MSYSLFIRKSFYLVFMFGLLASTLQGQQGDSVEITKINYLLHSIESLEGARFVRNGSAYSASEAVAHLRMKWHAAGKRVTTAEDFIRYCATESSMSGLPYTIQWSDGRVMKTADFLHQRLLEYDPSH